VVVQRHWRTQVHADIKSLRFRETGRDRTLDTTLTDLLPIYPEGKRSRGLRCSGKSSS
jgi:hypothetical protein